jgi:MscS family membrane protein
MFHSKFSICRKPVTNITEITHRRIDWIIGLEYKTTNAQLKKICSEIEKFILKDKVNFFVSETTPIIVKVSEFADSSINIMVRCFSNTKDYNEFINIKNILALQIKVLLFAL